MSNSADLRIEAVGDAARLNDFIAVPWHVYAHDPAWVPPLKLERREALHAKHPYFKHAEWQAWVMYDGATPIARISAQIDALHLERYGDATGHFGMIEAPDEPAIFELLFRTCEAWLRERGMKRVTGPHNLSVNQEVGVLVEGFDTPPFIMMGHSRPYYGDAVAANGYIGAKDLLAYEVAPNFDAPRVMRALCKRLASRVELRDINKKNLDQDLEVMRDIFNDAWSENWGFVPFTEEEFNAVGRELMTWVDDDFMKIAIVDGEPGAFIAALPNINEAIADLNGGLLPFKWAKFLWRLKVRYPRTARVPLMGVRKRYQHTHMGPGLAFLIIDSVRWALHRRGVEIVEMSWILEDNAGMRNIIESMGGVLTKRYRMYEKTL
ncbi:MAG: N-acetyltransferase [Gammaproteobacteria bacterium]|nr:N-acetyltransferase [Gammaproteobacteria bacterium]